MTAAVNLVQAQSLMASEHRMMGGMWATALVFAVAIAGRTEAEASARGDSPAGL